MLATSTPPAARCGWAPCAGEENESGPHDQPQRVRRKRVAGAGQADTPRQHQGLTRSRRQRLELAAYSRRTTRTNCLSSRSGKVTAPDSRADPSAPGEQRTAELASATDQRFRTAARGQGGGASCAKVNGSPPPRPTDGDRLRLYIATTRPLVQARGQSRSHWKEHLHTPSWIIDVLA